MPQPPVTLAEVREFFNFDASDTSNDDEVWAKAIAATEQVEAVCGAIVERDVTETLRADSCGLLDLNEFPVLSVTVVTQDGVSVDLTTLDIDADSGLVSSTGTTLRGRYDVIYHVGRQNVPQSLKEAVLLVTEQLWASQRGPSTNDRFVGNISQPQSVIFKGFLWPNRAVELVAPYVEITLA